MKALGDKLVQARKSMSYLTTIPYHKILTWARSLASMAASGQFVNDGNCQ